MVKSFAKTRSPGVAAQRIEDVAEKARTVAAEVADLSTRAAAQAKAVKSMARDKKHVHPAELMAAAREVATLAQRASMAAAGSAGQLTSLAWDSGQ